MSSLKDTLMRLADDYACAAYAARSASAAKQSPSRLELERHLADLIAEVAELAQQRGDLAAQVLDLQVASGLLARLYLAAGCVPQGTLSDGEFAFLRGAWMRAGNYLRLLPEDARPGTVASDSQPSEQTR